MSASDGATESVVPDIPFVRSGEDENRATFFELFFDLVYVFAIAQLSHYLVVSVTWASAAEAVLLLVAVYWAWNYTTWMANWFDPEVPAVQVVLVLVMLASLLMAVAIPEGFGDHALLFAASYCALQVGRNAFVVGVTPPGLFNRNFQQLLAWSVLSVPLWIGGAVADDAGRWGLWLAALGLDLAAPLVRFWAPRRGPTSMDDWPIDPALFSERFQLLLIIVLGESIVLTGVTATEAGLGTSVVVALTLGFFTSVALWWLYFSRRPSQAVGQASAQEGAGKVGRDAYTYLHVPIIAGVLLTAVADELVIAHPGDELGTAGALVTLGGPALYLLGLVSFGLRVGRHQPWTRLAAPILFLAAVPLAATVPALLVSGLVAACLALLVIGDWLGVGYPNHSSSPSAA